MEISYLREFCVLAETGSFLDAAERLFISQSTLSRHLKSLEEELGIQLFDRTTRKVEINEYGRLLLPHARTIVESQQAFADELAGRLTGVGRSLSIAAIPVMAHYGIVEHLVAFKKLNPGIALKLIEHDTCSLFDTVKEKRCDFAFVRLTEAAEDIFESIPVATDTLAAVLPPTHPLASRESLSLKELKNDTFILLPEDTGMYVLCCRACREEGFEPNIGLTGYRAENILNWVANGLGVSLLMKKPILQMAGPSVSIVDVKPTIGSQVALIYLKKGSRSPEANRFLKHMQACLG